MKIIGHRGAKNIEPENTLRSIKKALELGVSMIEIDVYVCASGEVVVIHDETIDRTTDGSGLVKDKTLEELKELDAGKGEHIPTLNEVIEFIDQRVPLIIELKAVEVIEPVIKIMQSYFDQGWQKKTLSIASFDHYHLLVCQNKAPEIGRIPVFEGIPLGYTEFVRSLDPSAIILYHGTINKSFVADAHAHDIQVYAYTINSQSLLERMRMLGVDAVATDRPDKIHA